MEIDARPVRKCSRICIEPLNLRAASTRGNAKKAVVNYWFEVIREDSYRNVSSFGILNDDFSEIHYDVMDAASSWTGCPFPLGPLR